MKKIIGIILVSFMVLQILSVFILPISAKFIGDVPELFWHGNSKIKKEYNENKIQFKEYSHLLTQEEMNQLKKRVGVYDKNKNYNIKYNELGTGLAPPSNEEWNVMVGTVNVVDNNLPNLPSATSIDLSTESYFPIVRSQGSQGSCAAWAATYYANGYIQAKNNDWNEASIGNDNHLLSPAFTYNKCNHGEDLGSHTWTNGYVMQDVGVCTWSEMPYNSGDDVNWGNENAWRDAPSYRISDIFMIDSYPANYDDSDINIIKNAVESGYPVTFALHASSYNNFGSDDVLGLNAMLTSYNHANTIVGYDDSVIDDVSGEIGAFKCVNSWGSTWGPNNNGYYWMTYNAFKGSQNVYPVCWFGDLYTDNDPKLLGVWELNPQSDRDANIELGIGSYSSPLGTRTPWWDGHSGTMHSYPSFMCLDITEFYNDWISNSNNFYLEFDNSLYNDGTISSFKIEYYDISYITGSPTQISLESGDVPLTTPGYVETQLLQTETEFPPDDPSNPNPGDGAINVDINMDLSWTGGDPDIGDTIEYDVYFGTTATPPFIGTVTIESYDQGTLSYSILYYWQIVSRDIHGSETTGPIWCFTTKDEPPNTPPDTPSNPNPVNGATGVPLSPTLSVFVNDIDEDNMIISFYELGGPLIGTDTIVGSGIATTTFTNADQYSTVYNWYTITDDSKDTTTSPTWSFTTLTTPPLIFFANQDIPVQNGGISGSYLDTHDSDNTYEGITEKKTGPKSQMEHKWLIPVDGGYGSYIFFLEAYHTLNSEGDDFLFAYSTDDITYIDMMTVTKPSDNNGYQTYTLPTSLSGTVYIRVIDADQTKGNNTLDTIYIDQIFIEASGTPPPNRTPDKPTDPDPSAGATGVDINPTLSVYVYDIDGDTMDVSFYNEFDILIGTDNDVASGSRASVAWLNLLYQKTYGWYAIADDGEYSNTSSTWYFTTRNDIPVGGMYVWDISWREKSAGKNTFLYYTITVRWDSNGNGFADIDDAFVPDATIYTTLTQVGMSNSWDHSGITDLNGQVEFGEKVVPGDYMAEVTSITHSSYTYNSALDQDIPDYYP